MKIKTITIAIFISLSNIFPQGSGGSDASYELRNLVDLPSAGIIEHGNYGLTLNMLSRGGVIAKFEVGLFNFISFGASYGGSNLIGSGKPLWYNNLGMNLKIRVFREILIIPSITIGIDTQGKGEYYNISKRYELKSPGIYLALTKNFFMLGFISLHGIINYSLEREDGDKDLNIGLGIEKTLGNRISFVAEYDMALNDNNIKSIGDGKGYLNAGLRISISSGFTLGVEFRNMLKNKRLSDINEIERALFVEYINPFF